MITIALLVPLAFQAQTSHASLHPASADLFLELPDFQAALKAYDETGFVRLLKDEDVRTLAAELARASGFGFELPADVQSALGLGFADAPEVVALVTSKLVRASVSVQTGAGGRQDLGVAIVLDFIDGESATLARATAQKTQERFRLARASESTGPASSGGIVADIWTGGEGTRVLVGGGVSCTSAALGKIASGSTPSVATSAVFMAGAKAFGAAKGTPLLNVVQGRGLLETLRVLTAMHGAEIASRIPAIPAGIDPYSGAQAWRMLIREGRFVTETFVPHAAGSENPGPKPIDAAWLREVPGDAMACFTTSFDGASVAEQVRTVAGASPLALENLAKLEEASGVTLEQLFSHLGPGMIANVGMLRGPSLPPTTLWFDLTDAAAFQADVQAIAAKLTELFPSMSIATKDYPVKDVASGTRSKIPITTLDLGMSQRLGMPLALFAATPSFTVENGRLLVGITQTVLKRELKRLHGGTDAGASEEAGDDAPTSLPPGDPFARADFALPEKTESALWIDWPAFVQSILTMVKAFAGMAGSNGLPFDPGILPEPALFTQYIKPTYHYEMLVAGGHYRYHEASFGPELLGAIAGAGLMVQRQLAPEPTVASALPAAIAGPELELTRTRLRDLRTAIMVYRQDQKLFPETLDALKSGTPAYPKGFLDGPELVVDGWNRAWVYRPSADQKRFTLWSLGANGADDGGIGDDVVN